MVAPGCRPVLATAGFYHGWKVRRAITTSAVHVVEEAGVAASVVIDETGASAAAAVRQVTQRVVTVTEYLCFVIAVLATVWIVVAFRSRVGPLLRLCAPPSRREPRAPAPAPVEQHAVVRAPRLAERSVPRERRPAAALPAILDGGAVLAEPARVARPSSGAGTGGPAGSTVTALAVIPRPSAPAPGPETGLHLVPWPALDGGVRARFEVPEPAAVLAALQGSRAAAARSLYRQSAVAGFRETVVGIAALVRSEGTAGFYDVRIPYGRVALEGTCSCPDFARRGGPCKHLGVALLTAAGSAGSAVVPPVAAVASSPPAGAAGRSPQDEQLVSAPRASRSSPRVARLSHSAGEVVQDGFGHMALFGSRTYQCARPHVSDVDVCLYLRRGASVSGHKTQEAESENRRLRGELERAEAELARYRGGDGGTAL